MSEQHGDSVRDDIFSKAVRAGKRTYFFDVKATRGNDLYLTITESKKRFHENGDQSFEKHKLFLYKEDFEKFAEGFAEAIDEIKNLRAGNNEFVDPADEAHQEPEVDGNKFKPSESFTNVKFEDLED
jgi:hypothetical protein